MKGVESTGKAEVALHFRGHGALCVHPVHRAEVYSAASDEP